MKEFIALWLAAQAHLRPASRSVYESWFRLHVEPMLGDLLVDRIGDTEVRAFAEELRGRVAPASVSNIMTLLRAVLEEACVQGLLLRNPARGLPLSMRGGRRRTRPIRVLSERQVHALLQELPIGSWQRALYATCLYAGLRSGEARGLQRHDVDLAAERIRVRQQAVGRDFGPLKTASSERDVVIHEALAHELRTQITRTSDIENPLDLLFPHQGRIMQAQLARYHLKCAGARAGILSVTLHDLRRTYGSIMIAAGADITFVQNQLGHSSPHITLTHYAALWDQAKNAQRVDTYLRLLDHDGTSAR
jgi:integrase